MNGGLLEILILNSAVALLLGGAAWLLARRGRYPSAVHALYLLALVKLITPPLWSPPAVPLPTPARPTAAPAAPPKPAVSTAPTTPRHVAAPLQRPTAAPVAAPAPSPSEPVPRTSWSELLAAGWIAGSAALLLLVVVRTWRFRRVVRTARPAPEPWVQQATALLPTLGLRRLPPIDVVRADIPPLVYPSLRGVRMLWPEPLTARLSAAQRETLILHELAHVRRRDPWARLLEVGIVICLWWHPLVWWLRAGLRDAEEASCDAWVTAGLPARARVYADALLTAAESLSPGEPAPVCATGRIRLRSWKNRLRSIMSTDVHARMGWRSRLGVLAVIAGVMPALPSTAQQPEPPANNARAPDAELWRRLETRRVQPQFDDAGLDAWTRALATATDVPIVTTPRARSLDASSTTLTDVSLPQMPLRMALDLLTQLTGSSWRVTHGTVEIDAPTPAVQIIGAVPRPGWTRLKAGETTVLEALSASGWNRNAHLERVHLIRPDATNPLLTHVDVRRMILKGDTTYNVTLEDGDLIVVPAVRQVAATPAAFFDDGHDGELAGRQASDWIRAGDHIEFALDPALLAKPGFEGLSPLTEPQAVGLDGGIVVPHIGTLQVLGLTERELATLVRQKLSAALRSDIDLTVRATRARAERASRPQRLAPGHRVSFLVEPSLVKQPGYELLAVLTEPQDVGPRGRILVPYVGRVQVAGMTEEEVEAVVAKELEKLFTSSIDPLHVRFSF